MKQNWLTITGNKQGGTSVEGLIEMVLPIINNFCILQVS